MSTPLNKGSTKLIPPPFCLPSGYVAPIIHPKSEKVNRKTMNIITSFACPHPTKNEGYVSLKEGYEVTEGDLR